MNTIVIATSTFYSPTDEVRISLSKKTFQHAIALGYHVVNVDDGSPKNLLDEYKSMGVHLYSQQQSGMGRGRRQAIRLASELSNDIVIWMEPEKESFVSQIPLLTKQLKENNADIIIPKRKSLKSYPLVQQKTEVLGNLFWKELTGTDLDIYFGPRMWRKELSKYFLEYDGRYGDVWDSIFIPIMDALFEQRKIVSTDVEYTHPVEQTKLEEHNLNFDRKRFEQLNKLSTALFEHWNSLNH